MKRRLVVALTALALAVGVITVGPTGHSAPAFAAGVSNPQPWWAPETNIYAPYSSGFYTCDEMNLDSTGLHLQMRDGRILWSAPWPRPLPASADITRNYLHIGDNYLQLIQLDYPVVNPTIVDLGGAYMVPGGLQLQPDGNLVILNVNGSILWSTNIAQPCLANPPTWTANSRFLDGSIWWNRNGCEALWVDDFGMHIGDWRGHVLWTKLFINGTYPNNPLPPYGLLKTDGYQTWLVTESFQPYHNIGWQDLLVSNYVNNATGTPRLVFQDDGNLVLLDGNGTPKWASDTNRGC